MVLPTRAQWFVLRKQIGGLCWGVRLMEGGHKQKRNLGLRLEEIGSPCKFLNRKVIWNFLSYKTEIFSKV